jgi:hypothetical protein
MKGTPGILKYILYRIHGWAMNRESSVNGELLLFSRTKINIGIKKARESSEDDKLI